MVVAAEPFERDHADRPRSDPTFTSESGEHGGRVVIAKPLEIDAANKADERRRAGDSQAVSSQISGSETCERLPGRHG